jgi:hypothetical protein
MPKLKNWFSFYFNFPHATGIKIWEKGEASGGAVQGRGRPSG